MLMPDPSPWWRHAVTYQVYLRSFADANGDGIGDIDGLRTRLPYLRDLGVDAIWVTPWYESPLIDGGYDVADYRSIHPSFGDLGEATELFEEARGHGLRVLVDLVPNHTSSEHRWFVEALGSGPGSAARSRYHFLPGRGVDGGEPPTDWKSVFGGSAWTRVPDGEWYLHLFDEAQPDLNWAHPEVRDEFDDVLRFWLDMGAAGFRVDVANALSKDPSYPDLGYEVEPLTAIGGDDHPYFDRADLHEIVRGWRRVLDERPDTVMVAEAWVRDWDRLGRYISPGEYHQAFDFLFLQSPWDRDEMRVRIETAIDGAAAVGSVPTWVLSNHDMVRHATRYALPQDLDARWWLLDGDRGLLDADLGLRRARAALLLMLGLPGSVYLYQGEELGLPEVVDIPFELLQDPVWARSGHTIKGRDGSRVSIPWTRDGPSAGFGADGAWLPLPAGWGSFSVEAQDGAQGSTLELYRSALGIRRDLFGGDGSMQWLNGDDRVIEFSRGGVTVKVNFGPEVVGIPDGEVLLSSGDLDDGLPSDTAVWVR